MTAVKATKLSEIELNSVVRTTGGGHVGVVCKVGERLVVANKKMTSPLPADSEVTLIATPRQVAMDFAEAHRWPTVSRPIAVVERGTVIALKTGEIAIVEGSDPVLRLVAVYVLDQLGKRRQRFVSWISEVWIIKTPQELADQFVWSHMVRPIT